MNMIGCKIKHDQIFNIKCTILTLVQHMRPDEQWNQMQKLFAVFDRLPTMAEEGNRLTPPCSQCTFPHCKACEPIVSIQEWLRSGRYLKTNDSNKEWVS